MSWHDHYRLMNQGLTRKNKHLNMPSRHKHMLAEVNEEITEVGEDSTTTTHKGRTSQAWSKKTSHNTL